MSIYILLLTGIPCCAYENCEDGHTELAGGQTQGHDEGQDKGCGTCSPFFCHSCSGCIIATIHYEPAPVKVQGEKVYNAIIRVFTPQYVPFLWQPPDLA